MSSRLVQLTLIDSIVETSPLPILLLVLFQFLLLFFQLGESGLDVSQQVGNLFALGVFKISLKPRRGLISLPVSSMIFVDSALFCS
jgi:hypothetical protein